MLIRFLNAGMGLDVVGTINQSESCMEVHRGMRRYTEGCTEVRRGVCRGTRRGMQRYTEIC